VYRLPYAPFFTIGDAPDEAVAKGANEALARLFAYEKEADGIACLVVEPVLGEGGFLPIHPAAFRVLREVCTRQGILLIADEVQSGFGRCGAWFACDRYGIVPDLMVMAKSLAGGMPLSAVSGPADVMDAAQVGGLGGTYGGNPVALAAALAVLDILEAEGLVERAEVIGRRVGACFAELARSHDFFANARGLGAMCAIDIIDPLNGNPDPERAGRLVAAARDRGLLMMTASGYVIRTLMPLTISDADLQSGLDILAEAAAEVAE
jgi:4-aminobutyrate aminotransferase-like enzyme